MLLVVFVLSFCMIFKALNSRNGFKKRIWECCKKLFSVGSIERRDAYSVLSLCLSSGSWTDETTESFVSEKDPVEFDLRSEQEFWDEIKKGLVWQNTPYSYRLSNFHNRIIHEYKTFPFRLLMRA